MATFEEFVAARSPALLRAAWLLTGDRHDAEELVQSALARTCAKFDRIDRGEGGSFEAYVRRAMHNEYVSWHRRLARQVVLAALEELSPRQREVVVLRFYEDLPLAEAAAVMGCSLGAVKSHQARALAALREHPSLRDVLCEERR
ncbi:SigE family RNA polymerase sigma factor [Nocardioides deserti]|uniref:SigE family RNA polymerase sigma factor n=1 Tax=Nocardioides deserti TaxID=1588644 RepID=A0ABR6U3L8_9ACTN|nr:SigE family RNA polymerase sigma factor [Nocardioides deserti]MBC2959012.1 SigE family RNA polymerase sigma factor [Nocardioides deserti]GGO68981.1 DNA-directed RNA polymerase sigma-70 factor [Nocardioides deserti]